MSKAIKLSLLAGGVVLAVGLLGSPASAVKWGPLSSHYNGNKVVSGSGDFYKSTNGTTANDKVTVTDTRRDGNTVYGRTAFQFWYEYQGQSAAWHTDRSKSTPEYSNTTGTYTNSVSLYSESDKARGVSQVCAQMGFPVPDSCSNSAYSTFSY